MGKIQTITTKVCPTSLIASNTSISKAIIHTGNSCGCVVILVKVVLLLVFQPIKCNCDEQGRANLTTF